MNRLCSLMAASVRSPGDGHFALKRIHLTPPAFEEIPFNPIGGQARCFLVGCGGFAVAMQPSQEIRPRGVKQVILIEGASKSEVVYSFQPELYPCAHGNGYSVVERDDRRPT